jgi:hypothetical protein
MILLPYLFVATVLVLVQLTVRHAMGAAVSIGDEGDYITCGKQADPYLPGIFLRVPLMAWMSKQAHRYSSNPERVLRSASGIASMVSIMLCMLSAQFLGGINAALLIGLLLVFMPGRIILSSHIWPDIWLGLWLSLVCLVLVYPDLSSNVRTLLVGSVAALAFITRFDALLLAPFAGFGLAPLPFLEWVFILLPTLSVFAFLSIRNARRYRIPWPDTTWMFNIMIAAGETGKSKAHKVHVEEEVQKVLTVWQTLEYPGRLSTVIASLRSLFSRPIRAISGVLVRLWASLGPDSFVLHRLLPPDGSAYPRISEKFNSALKIALLVAFPLFISMTILALLVVEPSLPPILWPTLAFATASLIHNRTRYRQAWLPGAALILVTAISEPGFWSILLSAGSTIKWLAAIALAISLVRFRTRPEKRENP